MRNAAFQVTMKRSLSYKLCLVCLDPVEIRGLGRMEYFQAYLGRLDNSKVIEHQSASFLVVARATMAARAPLASELRRRFN